MDIRYKYFIFKYKKYFMGIFFALFALSALFLANYLNKKESNVELKNTILEEAGNMSDSKNNFWWLNSGGLAVISDNNISTAQGSLEKNSKWQKKYAKSNPRDTENGFQPQNIFRLVTRQKWQNLTQSLYFNIQKINLSESKYRNESNGILLFNRYQNGNNLYYAGLRVDGDAVIKKKIEGAYYTIAEAPIYSGNKYDRNDFPNLIPLKKWIGIKSEVVNLSDKTVSIKLFIDRNGDGNWQVVLETTDSSDQFGKYPFFEPGYGGIRSDFMDVTFRDYSIAKYQPK